MRALRPQRPAWDGGETPTQRPRRPRSPPGPLLDRGRPAKTPFADPDLDEPQRTGALDPYAVKRLLHDHRMWPGRAYQPAPGECGWCGRAILKPDGTINRRRQYCDKRCEAEYQLRADPKKMRRYIYDRDMGICQNPECRTVFDFFEDEGWEADHIKPLFTARGDWSFWDPENLQLLCLPCHQEKSAHDNGKYRAVKRRRKEQKARRRR